MRYLLNILFIEMKKQQSLFVILFILSQPQLFTQERIIDDSLRLSSNRLSYIRAQTGYLSDAVFMGRKNTEKAPYLNASVGYYNKKGLFIRGALNYLAASGEGRVDLVKVSVGYNLIKENLSAGLSGSSYFFNDNSFNVISEITNKINTYIGYDLNVVELFVDAGLYFNSKNSDFLLGTELNHIFYAAGNRLQIIPTVYMNVGSQNYYNEYYENNRWSNGGHGKRISSSGPPVIANIVESTKFKLLAVELGLPLRYRFNQFRFTFTPTLSIPRSPSTITIEGNTVEEELDNTFFWSIGISYRWYTDKK